MEKSNIHSMERAYIEEELQLDKERMHILWGEKDKILSIELAKTMKRRFLDVINFIKPYLSWSGYSKAMYNNYVLDDDEDETLNDNDDDDKDKLDNIDEGEELNAHF
ncbi:hypothetical protein Tco_1437684 [Tanacetum coccineum]